MTKRDLLDEARKLRVLIAGDICLDRWCTYAPEHREPSRETGLPRLAVVSAELTPGAGGTVANNLAALGIESVTCLSAIGEDGHGFELSRELGRRGISADLLIRSPLIQTFTYTKLMTAGAGDEDQPRVDFINTEPLPESLDQELCRRLLEYGRIFDVILVSDQAETDAGGVVTPAFREALTEVAAGDPAPLIWVDSRARSELFRGVVLKVNQQEAEEASMRAFGRIDFARLRSHAQAPALFITHGSAGVLVVEPGGETWVKTTPVEKPVDICGAGDSFNAGASIALRLTGSAEEAARFGNLIAGITIMKKGTGTASPEEVLASA